MFYVVQENVFKERGYQFLLDTLVRFGFDHEIVKYRPFVQDIEHITDRKDVFCFGCTMMSTASMKYGWYPGSLMDENHDIEVYGKHYDMLNADSVVVALGDPIPAGFDTFFARPTTDTKAFPSKIYTREEWDHWINVDLAAPYDKEQPDGPTMLEHLKEYLKFNVFISTPKKIYQEIRCWVVGGNVVSISQYKIGDRVHYLNLDHEMEPWKFAQSQVWKYQVAEAFVLDICLTEDGYKVLEVNCISSAGFYDVNMQKLLMALEDHFNPICARKNDPAIDDDTEYFKALSRIQL